MGRLATHLLSKEDSEPCERAGKSEAGGWWCAWASSSRGREAWEAADDDEQVDTGDRGSDDCRRRREGGGPPATAREGVGMLGVPPRPGAVSAPSGTGPAGGDG